MMSVSLQHWSDIVGTLATQCPPALYHAFVSQATPMTVDEQTIARPGDVVRIAVERDFVDTFQSALAGYVSHAIRTCAGMEMPVHFVTREPGSGSDSHLPRVESTPGHVGAHNNSSNAYGATSPAGATLDRVVPHAPLHDYDAGTNSNAPRPHPQQPHAHPSHIATAGQHAAAPPPQASYGAHPAAPTYPAAPPPISYDAPAYGDEKVRVYSDTHSLPLNPCNTFDNFITGPSNRIAHAAAMAVSEHPGAAYNPLFLHGSVGLGKTHLLQAIALRLQQVRPGCRLLYISCETFMSQFVNSIRANEVDRFQRQFRDLDCLIIDDIHTLAGDKSRTQDEFFHTFNALYGDRKQIVLSSDSPPGEIPQLQDRLVSRFKSGLQAKIEPPEFETRLGIFRQKAQQMQQELSDEILTFLAERFTNNVREMEGAIKTISAVREQHDGPLTLKDVRRHLNNLLEDRYNAPASRLTPDEIITEVISYYRTTEEELRSDSRQKHVALPRQVCMYLIKKLTSKTFVEIGKLFGGRDHSTVIHSVSKIEKLSSEDEDFRSLLAHFERKLQSL